MTTVEDAFVAYRTTRDPAALAAVYDGTSSRMLAVALHLSGSASAAEDAVQDTFLFALENPERWDASRPLMPWLLGILSNILKQSAYRARRTPDPERLQLPDATDPESAMAANELLSSIEQAITDLPQPYRTVVLLRLRNGLSPADIAVALDRKPSTVRAQLTRGVEMLRKVLPTGVAGLLIGTVALSRGLTAAREVVMNRAGELHRVVLAQQSAAALRFWGLRAAALACVALTAWGVSMLGGEPSLPTSVVTDRDVEPAVAATETEQAELLQLAEAAAPMREQVALVGALDVMVRRAGNAMPQASVTLEPLSNPPLAIVHRTSASRGTWQRIESLRPALASRHKRGTTGGDGRCHFDELSPGFWICRSLGKDVVVQVAPGKTTAQVLAVDPGSRLVRGLVLGVDGQPLVGAPVWSCREHLLRVRREVARTDASGRFELVVAPYTTIGALHEGHAPIGITVGRKATLPPLDLVLQFREVGAVLAGVVRDERGEPIAGAEVEVGHASDTRVAPEVGSVSVVARPVRVRTDADGKFRVASLVPGETRVLAQGSGHGAASRIVALRPGNQQSVVLTLPKSSSIHGVVHDASGEPMAGVSVRIGRPGSMSFRSTATGRDGRYRLDDLTAGQAVVEFNNYRGGFASHLQDCEAGVAATLDAVLSASDLVLAGQVVTESGAPMAHGWVQHRHHGRRNYQLDGDGRFAIRVSERFAAIPSNLLVFFDDPRGIDLKDLPAPQAVRIGVRPGPQSVLIKLGEPQQLPSCWLRGSVRMVDGKVPSNAVLVRRIDDVGWRYRSTLATDGSFRIGPLPPGRYLVRMADQNGAFGPFAVTGDESIDVGTLEVRAEPDASSPKVNRHVALVYPAGVSTVQSAFLEVRDQDGRVMVAKTQSGSITEMSGMYVRLPKGRFTLRVTTEQGYEGQSDVAIDPASPKRRAIIVPLALR